MGRLTARRPTVSKVLWLLVPLLAGGCIVGDNLEKSAPGVPAFTMDQLRAAPETLRVGNTEVTARAELWRNFMPISPPDGGPLGGVVDLTPADSAAGLPAVTDAYVWVLNGSRAWATALAPEEPVGPANTKRYRFGGGPKWGPGISVDVVVGLRTRPDHIDLVHAGKVPISRLD